MRKVLFIGLGHMGSSLFKGILKNKKIEAVFYGYDTFKELQDKVINSVDRAKTLNNLEEIISIDINYIIFAVRPIDFDELCDNLNKLDLTNKTIISMVNAIEIEDLKSKFKQHQNLKIIRIMPNMNASIQKSVTAIAHSNVAKEELDFVIKMFESCGIVELIEEKNFATFTAISGCLPAYVFTFFKAITDYGIQNGIEKEKVFRIVEQSIIGSIENASNSGIELKDMIASICVPNGSTIQGQKVLEDNDFEQIIKKCLEQADKYSKPIK
ncbi:pyrroline-5-carboxylate reductase family protein [Spiroplasma cantharicola]|uniref:Pyrroline-5-carboxylate reductase n=1 Tax=Spiroplasma cantharicola TaxID=362837 RepID=A0A0M5KJD5_9MOLU|nr:pyrroline-5-carboxylate reductase dimerization domain-containing protein [Spiroplasma cantharicola]ALD66819.1 pyrroline-5-carboxylate reductase [Spiroplasma cantharicola]